MSAIGGAAGHKPRAVLGDLADWDLPSLETQMNQLIELLQQRKLMIALDRESLGEQVYVQLWDHVRASGATAANEALAGWMQGVAAGCPELCVRFPYLEGEADAGPLMIVDIGRTCGRTRLAISGRQASGMSPKRQYRPSCSTMACCQEQARPTPWRPVV
jgi:hypothetical protein